MTLTELKYIVTLSQSRHFGRAAEACHVSQPTLSVAIKKLESELGVAIFERGKNSVSVTPLGEKIVSQARRVLDESRSIKELASAGKHQLNSPLKLGAIFSIGPYLFPHLIPALRSAAPHMPMYLEEGYTGTLRRQLSDGELDAIIVALPFTEPDVVCRELYQEPFEVVLPIDHHWAKFDRISPEQLLEEDLLLLGEGHCFRDQVLNLCPALSRKPNSLLGNVTQGSSLESIKHMVATGLGITVLPRSAIYEVDRNWVMTKPFVTPTPTRRVALAWRASFPRTQAIDLLIDVANTLQTPWLNTTQ